MGRRFILIAWLTSSAWAQATQFQAQIILRSGTMTIQSDGQALVFPDSEAPWFGPKWLEAVQAPRFFITDASGTGAGWQVTASAQDLLSPAGQSISGSHFYFVGRGSSPRTWGLAGDPCDPAGGPLECDGRVPLSNSPLLYCRPGHGRGRFGWSPQAQQFQLELPQNTAAGSYQGQMTFTVMRQP